MAKLYVLKIHTTQLFGGHTYAAIGLKTEAPILLLSWAISSNSLVRLLRLVQ